MRRKLVERIINGRSLIAVNKQAVIVTSKSPMSCPTPASFYRPVVKTTIVDPEKTKGPPGGITDHRGWIYGDLQITGYAYSLVQKASGSRGKKCTPPSWWVGSGWIAQRKGFQKKHRWWCMCRVCGVLLELPWSTPALNKRERDVKAGIRNYFRCNCFQKAASEKQASLQHTANP